MIAKEKRYRTEASAYPQIFILLFLKNKMLDKTRHHEVCSSSSS